MTAPAQSPPGAIVGFVDPDRVGATRPAIRDMIGRVVVIRPTRLERDVQNPTEPGKTQDRITADVLVLDGGPMEFGGNLARHKPLTMTVPTPFLVKAMYISNTNIVKAVEEQVGRGVVLGRITVGVASNPQQNPPFNLIKVDQSDPKYAAAVQVYTEVVNNTFVNPEPTRIGAAPSSVTVNGTPATYVPAGATIQTPTPPTAAAAPAVDPQAAFLAWQAEQAAKSAPAETIPAAPSGWPEETWRGLTDEQRSKVLDSIPPFA